MEVEFGHLQTEIDTAPRDWVSTELGEICQIYGRIGFRGYTVNDIVEEGEGAITISPSNIVESQTSFTKCTFISWEKYEESPEIKIENGDILLVKTGSTVGKVAIVKNLPEKATINPQIVVLKKIKIDNTYLGYLMSYRTIQDQIASTVVGGALPTLSQNQISRFKLNYPPSLTEQQAIAEALSDADALIEALEQLITKKRQIRQGAMQALLTGKRRLPGFSEKWRIKRISEIAIPTSEKNSTSEDLPVLTCSKHLGFVDSLSYFKNQVFSDDTSNYKIVRKGQIGYPANHVEEGSIGLQDIYEVALVSPIYVVFSVTGEVDSYFLHRTLKLDSYRQKFQAATTSSVDRRGSLRWPAFSEITVIIPPLPEQKAIVTILSDMDAEINMLEEKLEKTRYIKQGMMQELLTGRIRLV